ncbi:MAG TPA: GNAT family protein [Candidatus Limnocylindria bacterium]
MTESRPPVPERPLLSGDRVWLRPLEERDMPAYVAAINDTEVGGIAGYGWPQSVGQATAWLTRVMEGWGRDGFFFAVCELGDDRFVGTTWLKELNLMHGNAELAICMDRDHIGAGWGSEAQRVLLAFAFRTVGLARVYLTTSAEDNARAIRSYEKVGFQVEGRMRSAYRGAVGLHDALLMSILREEWEAANP